MDKISLRDFYLAAHDEAKSGIRSGHGGPFGAVVVKDGEIVGSGHNTVLRDNDPTAHAEVNAIRDACRKLDSPHLEGCILIASSEPCPMCMAAGYWARLREIRYCVPADRAKQAGFDDTFIYEELTKPMEKRRIMMRHDPEMQQEGEDIFLAWKESGGQLY